MIAMIAFACSRSDRHVSLPTNNNPNNPSNPNKPGFLDGGSGANVTIPSDADPQYLCDFLPVGESKTLTLNVWAGTYKITSICNSGKLSWTVNNGEKTFTINNNNNIPYILENVNIPTSQDYSIAVSNTGAEDASFEINFLRTDIQNKQGQILHEMNKDLPYEKYYYQIADYFPNSGQQRIGAWGPGGALSEFKFAFKFDESRYGEATNSHELSIVAANCEGVNVVENATITKRAAPNDDTWDFVAPISSSISAPSKEGLMNVVVGLKDEEEHLYFVNWEFLWYSKLPQITNVLFFGSEPNKYTQICFQTDRAISDDEKPIFNSFGAVTFAMLGKLGIAPQVTIYNDPFKNFGFDLPFTITEKDFLSIAQTPFIISITPPSASAQLLGLSTTPNSLIRSDFWQTVISNAQGSSLDSNNSITNNVKLKPISEDCGCSSSDVESKPTSKAREVSTYTGDLPQVGCSLCLDLMFKDPYYNTIYPINNFPLQIFLSGNGWFWKPASSCCNVHIWNLNFDNCIHTANTCNDQHRVKFYYCSDHTCDNMTYYYERYNPPKPEYSYGQITWNVDGFRFFNDSTEPLYRTFKPNETEKFTSEELQNWGLGSPHRYYRSAGYKAIYPHDSDILDGRVVFYKGYYGNDKKDCSVMPYEFIGDHQPPEFKKGDDGKEIIEIILPEDYGKTEKGGLSPDNLIPSGLEKLITLMFIGII